jgi:hypothetical protein
MIVSNVDPVEHSFIINCNPGGTELYRIQQSIKQLKKNVKHRSNKTLNDNWEWQMLRYQVLCLPDFYLHKQIWLAKIEQVLQQNNKK